MLVGGASSEGGSGASGPLIWRGAVGDQPAVALAFDLASSNIGQRVAFPILVSRIVADLTVSALPGTVVIGEPVVYAPSLDAAQVTFSDPAGGVSTLDVSDTDGTTRNDVTFDGTGLAGVYAVRELGSDGQVVGEGAFVVNAGHPEESNLRPVGGLAESLTGGPELTSRAAAATGASELWPILAAVALLLIVAEWLVACGLRSWLVNRSLTGGRFTRWARP